MNKWNNACALLTFGLTPTAPFQSITRPVMYAWNNKSKSPTGGKQVKIWQIRDTPLRPQAQMPI